MFFRIGHLQIVAPTNTFERIFQWKIMYSYFLAYILVYIYLLLFIKHLYLLYYFDFLHKT